jgi:glutamine amidotransferase
MDTALKEAFAKGTPIMGICLGTQIVLDRSEEEDTPCIGLLAGTTLRFKLQNHALKIPHMGWDSLSVRRSHPILKDVRPNDEFYFVHSFYPQPADASMVLAACEYEVHFPAAIGFRNLFATQFHPEKRLQILRNFASWDGNAC